MPSLTDDLRNDPTDGRAQNEGVVLGAISGGGNISDDLPLPTLPNDFPTATASNSAPLDNFQTPVTDVSSAAPVVDNGMPIDPVTPPPQTAFVSMATSASPISSVSAPSTAPAPTFASVAVPGVTEANSTIFNTPTIDTPSPTVSTVDYSTPINSAIGFSGSASSYAEDFAKRFEQASQNAPIGPDLSVQMSTEPIPGQISSNFSQRFAQAQVATAPTADTSTPNASTVDYSTPAVPATTDDVPPAVQNLSDQSSVFADDAPDPVIINNVNTDPTPTNEKSASGVILSSMNEPIVAAIDTVTPLKVTPATSERSAATPTVDTVAPSTAAYNIPSYQDTSPTTTVEKSVAQPVKSVKTEPVTANSSPISPVRESGIASHAPTPEPTTSVSSVSTQNNKPSLKIDGPSLSTNSNLSTDPDSITNKHLDGLGLEQSKETIKKAIDAQEKERFAEAMPDVSTPVPTANEHVEMPAETVSTTNDRAEIKVEPPAPAFDTASSSDYSTPANSANEPVQAETTVTVSSTPEPAPAATPEVAEATLTTSPSTPISAIPEIAPEVVTPTPPEAVPETTSFATTISASETVPTPDVIQDSVPTSVDQLSTVEINPVTPESSAATSVSDTTTSSTVAYNIPSNQAISDNSAPAFVENVTPADAAASTPAASAPETNRGEHYAQYLGSADQVNPVTATAGVVGGLTGLAVPARNPEPAVNADSAGTQNSEPSLKVSGPSLSTNSKMSTDPDSAAKKHLDQLGLGHSKGGLRDKINSEEEARLKKEDDDFREKLAQTEQASRDAVAARQKADRDRVAARDAEQLARARGEITNESSEFGEKVVAGATATVVAPAAVAAETGVNATPPEAGAADTLASDQAAFATDTPISTATTLSDANTVSFAPQLEESTLASDQAAPAQEIMGSEVTAPTLDQVNIPQQTSTTADIAVTSNATTGDAPTVIETFTDAKIAPTVSVADETIFAATPTGVPSVGGLTMAPTGATSSFTSTDTTPGSDNTASSSVAQKHLEQLGLDHSKGGLRDKINAEEDARLAAKDARFQAELAASNQASIDRVAKEQASARAVAAARDAAQLQAAREAAIHRQLESMSPKQLSQLAHSLGIEPTPAAPPLPADTFISTETLSAATTPTYDLDALAHQLETLATPSTAAATINLPEYGDFNFDATSYLPPETGETGFAVQAPTSPFASVAEPGSFAATTAGVAASSGLMPNFGDVSVSNVAPSPTAGQIYSSAGASGDFIPGTSLVAAASSNVPAGTVTHLDGAATAPTVGGTPQIALEKTAVAMTPGRTNIVYDAGGESGGDRALAGLAVGGVVPGGAAGVGMGLTVDGAGEPVSPEPGRESLAENFHNRTGLGESTNGQVPTLDKIIQAHPSGALPAHDGTIPLDRAGGQLAHQAVSAAKRGLNPLKDVGSGLVTKFLPNAIDSLRRLNKRLRRAIQALSWLMPVLVPLGAGLAVFLTIAGIWLAIVGLFDSGAAENQAPGATATESSDDCLMVKKIAEPSKIGNPPDASADKKVKYTIQISAKDGQTAIFDDGCNDQIKVKCKKEGGDCSSQSTDISGEICQQIKEKWGEKLTGAITVEYERNYTGGKDYLMSNTVTFKAHCEKKESAEGGATSSTDDKSSGGTASRPYTATGSVCVGECGGDGLCWPFEESNLGRVPHGGTSYSKQDIGLKYAKVYAPITGTYTYSYSETECTCKRGGMYRRDVTCNEILDHSGECKGCGKCGPGCSVIFTDDKVSHKAFRIMHLTAETCTSRGVRNGQTKGGFTFQQGEIIGTTDTTGANTAPHTHFEIYGGGNSERLLKYFFPSEYMRMGKGSRVGNKVQDGPASRYPSCDW